MELVTAIRQSNMDVIRDVLARPDWDINARVRVPGTRISVYESHALFEAARSGSVDILRLVLSRPDLDVNQPAAAIHITTLADACNRGAEAVASVLLEDSRIDPKAGSDETPLALQYACSGGHLAVVELFAKAGFITFDQESALVETALCKGHVRVAQYVTDHLLSRRSMVELEPRYRVAKVWQEFNRVDEDNNGHVDIAELRTLAAALGTPLTEPELAEARVALDTDGNGKVDFEEFVAFWLSDEGGIDPQVVAAAAEIQLRGRLTTDFGPSAPSSAAEAADAAEWGAAPVGSVTAAAGAALASSGHNDAEVVHSGSAPGSVLGAGEGSGSAVRGIDAVTDYA